MQVKCHTVISNADPLSWIQEHRSVLMAKPSSTSHKGLGHKNTDA